MTWLDSRLRYRADRPPDNIATGDEVVTLESWRIPVTVGGEPRTLTGRVEWVPSGALAGMVRRTPASHSFPWVPVGLGAAAMMAALGGLLLRRRLRVTR